MWKPYDSPAGRRDSHFYGFAFFRCSPEYLCEDFKFIFAIHFYVLQGDRGRRRTYTGDVVTRNSKVFLSVLCKSSNRTDAYLFQERDVYLFAWLILAD